MGERMAAVSAMKWTPRKDDDVGAGAGGFSGQSEGVSDVVGDILDFGAFIVVGENDRVPLTCGAADLLV